MGSLFNNCGKTAKSNNNIVIYKAKIEVLKTWLCLDKLRQGIFLCLFLFAQNTFLSTKHCNIVPIVCFTIAPMTVYVEQAFLDNLSMDCLILYLATMSLKLPTKWHRILLGGVVGSVTALLTFTLTGVLLYVAKFLSLLLMCIATVGFGKQLFWCIATTCVYTFLIGGAIVGLFNLGQSFVGGVIYQSDVPLFCYFFAVLLVVVLTKLLVVYLKDVKKVATNLVKCQVVLNGEHHLQALYDSGNSATCHGLPLCFVSKKFADVFAKRLLCGQTVQVNISTVAGNSTVFATKGKLVVGDVSHDVYFAIAKMPQLYDVILANSICLQQSK